MVEAKRKKGPRPADSYRAARRNRVRAERGVWQGIEPTAFYEPRYRLNRSRHLDGKPTLTPYN